MLGPIALPFGVFLVIVVIIKYIAAKNKLKKKVHSGIIVLPSKIEEKMDSAVHRRVLPEISRKSKRRKGEKE